MDEYDKGRTVNKTHNDISRGSTKRDTCNSITINQSIKKDLYPFHIGTTFSFWLPRQRLPQHQKEGSKIVGKCKIC